MPAYVKICLNLAECFLFQFLMVNPCLPERVATYFNVYGKLEVSFNLKNYGAAINVTVLLWKVLWTSLNLSQKFEN